MKMQALREVQEKLKNEMARRRGAAVSGNESGGSYRTAEGNGPSQRMSGLDTPPGLPVQPSYVSPMVQPQGVQQPTPMMMAGTPGVSQPMVVSGEALNESLRMLELPKDVGASKTDGLLCGGVWRLACGDHALDVRPQQHFGYLVGFDSLGGETALRAVEDFKSTGASQDTSSA